MRMNFAHASKQRLTVTAVATLAAALFGLLLVIASVAPRPARAANPNPNAVATDRLRDLTATLVVTQADFKELGKIGGDFKTTYRFKRLGISYKNPNKIRLETKILGRDVLLVFNAGVKTVKIPFRKDVRDVSREPGQKQSLMHLGLFARDFLATDWRPTYLRNEGTLQVYRLNGRNTANPAYEIVWVNPRTAIIERRQSIKGDGKLRMEVRYKNALEAAPGVWVPRRVEVYNQFGKLAGVQEIQNIRVNVGVSDDRFRVS